MTSKWITTEIDVPFWHILQLYSQRSLHNTEHSPKFLSLLLRIFHDAHLAIAHVLRDRMLKELSLKYENFTHYDIQQYIHICESFLKKTKWY